jgi:5-methylcytosine-specific restriction endonuclease McrA
MRRDGFRCRHCGRSPATSPGTVLVIDHIVPWSQWGETEYDNLQTLCVECNGGKSDLSDTEE